MANLIFALLVLSIIIAILLATTIFIASAKNRLNRFLAIFTFFISIWALGDILMLYSNNMTIARIGAVLFYVGPMITTLFLLFFADSSPNGSKVKNSVIVPASLVTIVISWLIIIQPDLILKGIDLKDGTLNVVVPNVGIFYYIYSLYFNIFFIITYVKLIRRFLRNIGIFRSQMLIMIIGISITSALAVATNLIMPQYGIYDKVWLGPIFTLFFAGMTVFAIIKYRYLNIRFFVARSVAYLLLVSTLISIYAVVVFGLATSLPDQKSTFVLKVVPILTALFLAGTAPFFKRLFDHLTNRVFYQKSYSVNVALSEVSSFATRSVDASQIQLHTLRVIDKTLRPEYALFLMFDSKGALSLGASTGNYSAKTFELEELLDDLGKLHQKITLADDMKQTDRKRHYVELAHIGAITRLSTSNKSIGFLVLGEKKNGGSYNGHDLRFLTLIANDLALALQNAKRYEEIQAFNATLQYKINNATRALKRTNEKLIALDDAKDDFISMASHQLRTPLTSIKGYVSMMLEGDLGKINARQRDALKEAFDSSQRMVFLISDFLNVSRIRTGKFALELVRTDLSQIIKEEIEQLRDMAGLRGQKIIFAPGKEIGVVMLDEMKIRQVMMNMIDNAIFYTPKKGTITITLEKSSQEIIFKVADTGIGVPLKVQHRLFTKFYRAENAKKARPDGTGLGLFMAQKIISAQGGAVIFKSVENEGSTFGFRFPLNRVGVKS